MSHVAVLTVMACLLASRSLRASAESTTLTAAPNTGSGTADSDYWPTHEWRISTPEEQGMDPELLFKLLHFIKERRKNINSVLIVRNGYLVTEAYFNPYERDTKHGIYSCTKSIVSALIGIAIKDGYISDLNQKVLDLFPELKVASIDPSKEQITLEHVLNMTIGLDWREAYISYSSKRNSLVQMLQSEDWVQFLLDRPMVTEPGIRFNYNSGASHLLSAIIQHRTGMTASSYADEHLFKPLGISTFYWPSDPNGITIGGWGLQMTSSDMAKFGYLYLKNGMWDGQQIIAAKWVEESTKKRIKVIASTDYKYRLWALLLRLFRRESPPNLNYGNQWWTPSFGGYAARGLAGQAIFVMPSLDMIVVLTGGLNNSDAFLPERLVENFILPAARSFEALPSDQKRSGLLKLLLQEIARPRPNIVPLPGTAKAISGKTYVLKTNSSGIQSLSITFRKEDEGLLKISYANNSFELPVGLDNVFRTTRIVDQESVSLKGYWSNDKTFIMDWRSISSGDKVEINLAFQGEKITIRSRGTIQDQIVQIKGNIKK